jgi:hypothetical protein
LDILTLVEAEVLNAEQPHATDFMIGPSLAVLCYQPGPSTRDRERSDISLVDRLLADP